MKQTQILATTHGPLPAACETKVHLLPLTIEYDGPALISSYFQPNDDVSTFRGINLRGKTDSLSGIVVCEEHSVPDEAEDGVEKVWAIESHFNEITHW